MTNLVPYIQHLSVEEQDYLVKAIKDTHRVMDNLHRGSLPFVSFDKAEWALGSNWYLGEEEPYITYKRLQISLIKKLRSAANIYAIKAYGLGKDWPTLEARNL